LTEELPLGDLLLPMSQGAAQAEAVQEELVAVARDAAVAGDVIAMLEALTESRFLEALQRYMEVDWPHLDGREIVSGAVDEFYRRAGTGTAIRKPMGYLFMTVKKMAIKEHEKRTRNVEFSDASDEASVANSTPTLKNRVPREERKSRALAIARSLLPRIGQDTLRGIASYYLEAVERDATRIDDEELANAFGLTNETARRLKNRALERLAREARDAGISLASEFGPNTFGDDDDKQDE
jgi:DNA-directed RNA polymerase specialized sigma24 family protein